MKKSTELIILLFVFLTVLVMSGCAPAPTPVPPTTVPPTTVPPTTIQPTTVPPSREWTASAEFGTFVFDINPEGTAITKLQYGYENYKCGTDNGVYGWNVTGEVSPIIDNQFTLTLSGNAKSGEFSLTHQTTITGKFDKTGTNATGTWKQEHTYPIEFKKFDTSCSGTWKATAPK